MGTSDRVNFGLASLEDRVMFNLAPLADAGATAMAYDAGGVLHAAYYDPVRANLHYTTRAPGGAWSPSVTVDAAHGVGSQLSLAIDSTGRPAIAYYDAANKDLKYARLDGAGWSRLALDAGGRVGRNPSLAFGPGDLPLISYYATSGQDLRIASFNGRRWHVTTVDSADSVGQYSSLAISPIDGSWAVAYESQTDQGIKFAQRRRRSFSVALIDTLGPAGDWSSKPSLAFNSLGRAVVGYADPAQDAVRLTVAARRGWSTVTAVSNANVANDTAVSIDPHSGQPQFVYLDRAGEVNLATPTAGGEWDVAGMGQAVSTAVAVVDPVTQTLSFVSGASAMRVDTTLRAPTGLRQDPAIPRRAHETFVRWNDVLGETGYVLERSGDAGRSWSAVTPSPLPSGTTTFADTGLRESVDYRYRVRAVHTLGASPWSKAAAVATAAFRVLNDEQASNDTARTAPYSAHAGIDRVYMADTNYGGAGGVRRADGTVNTATVAHLVGQAVAQDRHGFVYDLEGELLDLRVVPEAVVRARIDFLRALIAESKRQLPAGYDMTFGFWNLVNLDAPEDMTNADRVLAWHRATDFLTGRQADGGPDPDGATHDVRAFMDFVAPALYTHGEAPEEWGRTAQLALHQAKRFQLPVYAWITPYHVSGPRTSAPLSAERWRHQIELVRQAADGLDIWEANTVWMPTAPWWLQTQAFLDPAALAGDVPGAPTNAIASATGQISWSPSAGDPAGYVIEKGRPGGDGQWSWEVVGAAPEPTWHDHWVQVGPQYRYRVFAQNRHGLSAPLTFDPAVGRRDAFGVIPVGSFDAEDSGTNSYAFRNAAGEHLRLHFYRDGEHVRYENVVFPAQPYAMDFGIRTYDFQDGGVLEVWLDRGTPAATRLGSLTIEGLGNAGDAPLTVQRMLLRPDVDLTRPHGMDIVFRGGVTSEQHVNVDWFRISDAAPSQDAATGGAWRARYGDQGAWVALDQADAHLPAADLLFGDVSTGDWGAGAAGALQRADGSGHTGGRVYDTDPFTVDVTFRDDEPHRLSAYFFEGDGAGRTQRVELLRQSVAGGTFDTVIHGQTLADFAAGRYLSWVVGGTVQIRVTPLTGPDAVLSGVFVNSLGGFAGTDATTRGDWKGRYGSEFAYVAQDATVRPDYLGKFEFLRYDGWDPWWAWSTQPADPTRLPLTIDGTNGERTGAFEHWEVYANSVLDIELTDDRMHRLSLYFNFVRAGDPDYSPPQVVSIYNADDEALIDSRTIVDFASGKYLSWNVSGRVRVRVFSLHFDTYLTGAFLDPVHTAVAGNATADGNGA